MKQKLLLLAAVLLTAINLRAQIEPKANTWTPWLIPSVGEFRLPPPPAHKKEIAEVRAARQKLDSAGRDQILYWNAGYPGYRWYGMMVKKWMSGGAGDKGALAQMLVGTAIYDAILAAWDTKYAYNRPRPFAADPGIASLVPEPKSPSYPCEHSTAAGAAVAVISHFYPELADSVQRMANRLMASRVAAGVAYPSDTRAGFELGKKIALREIEKTREYITDRVWDGKIPQGPAYWKGTEPSLPLAGLNKTVTLDSASQFRPGPPPDYAKDMAELKNFKPSFFAMANAWFYASQTYWDDLLNRKVFEYNLHLNPPRAARIYAATAVAYYDGFSSCWDAKYAYWGIRPEQYDTTFQPVLLQSPPFPGYPSGHAMLSSVMAELFGWFFPAEKTFFRRRAMESAESRFQGGIHFRTDNEVAADMGKKVANMVIQRLKKDGADAKKP